MTNFRFLCENEIDGCSEKLYVIYAKNMTIIAPTGENPIKEYTKWKAELLDLLSDSDRRIVLCESEGKVIGYFRYSVKGKTFFMEDIQILSQYHGKDNVFRELHGFVIDKLPECICHTEAVAYKNNGKSIAILHRLGLKLIGVNNCDASYYFKGQYSDLLKWYNKQPITV